jgi:phosphatidylglycerophosphatase A
LNLLVKFIGTFAYTGFFPLAPATFASAVFLAIYVFVPGGEVIAHPIVCLVTLIVSVPVSTRLEKEYGEDPPCVVIDEVAGMQVILVSTADLSWWGIGLAFLLFRIFDVVKPFPINRSQKLRAGYGIVIDDLLAGLYARVVLIAVAIAYPSIGNFIP